MLRAPQPRDVDDRYAAGRDPEFRRMVGAVGPSPGPYSVADANAWYAKVDADAYAWVIEHEHRAIGTIGLHRLDVASRSASLTIGIFAPRDRGRGLGTAAVRLLVAHAFQELELSTIRLRVLAYNARAIACYQRCGFVEMRREPVDLDGAPAEDIVMELTRERIPFLETSRVTWRSACPRSGCRDR